MERVKLRNIKHRKTKGGMTREKRALPAASASVASKDNTENINAECLCMYGVRGWLVSFGDTKTTTITATQNWNTFQHKNIYCIVFLFCSDYYFFLFQCLSFENYLYFFSMVLAFVFVVFLV